MTKDEFQKLYTMLDEGLRGFTREEVRRSVDECMADAVAKVLREIDGTVNSDIRQAIRTQVENSLSVNISLKGPVRW